MSTDTKQPLDIEAIKAREAAATPGPWVAEDDNPDRMHGFYKSGLAIENSTGNYEIVAAGSEGIHGDPLGVLSTADAEFIAHARTDIPALLERVAELEAALRPFAEMTDDECHHLYLQEIARARHALGMDK